MRIPPFLITFCAIASLLIAANESPLHAQQQPTDLSNDGLRPETGFQAGRGVTFEVDVSNLGPEPAITYLVQIQVANDATPVYEDFVEMTRLEPGESKIAAFTSTWTPSEPGQYVVRTQIAFQEDINPPNNQRFTEIFVNPPYISLEEAVAILDESIIIELPNKDEIKAYYNGPPNNPDDSVHARGTMISNWSGELAVVDYPAYVFFVDVNPGDLWEHEALCVFVPATSSTPDTVQWYETRSPIIINNTSFHFGPSCGSNKRRVKGGPFNCEPVPDVSLSSTSNNKDWAIIVTGRVIESVDGVTIGHDVKKASDRINSGKYGPKINKNNIDIVQGAEGAGATKKDLCDALEKIKGRDCEKVIIKYIGHGTKEGLVLMAEGENATAILPWTEFAKKVKELGAGNVCIDITSCHAGSAVQPLKDAGVKGSVITSSNSDNTTPQGTGSGTYWEESLQECSESIFADLNKDSSVSNKEAARWVYTRKGANDKATTPKPQIVCLNSTIKSQTTSTTTIEHNSWKMSGSSGSLSVYLQRTCVRTKFKGAKKDSVLYKTNIYVKNGSTVERAARRPYQIIARCKRGKKSFDTVLTIVQPRLARQSEVCVATLPDGCVSMRVVEVPKKKGLPEIVFESDSGQAVDLLEATIIAMPGEYFRVEHTFIDPDKEERYTAETMGPEAWNVGQDPVRFSSVADSTTMVDAWGWVPLDSLNGGDLSTTLLNDTTLSEIVLTTTVLLPYAIDDANSPIDPGHHRQYSVRQGDHEVSHLTSSRIELDGQALVYFTSDVDLDNVTIVSDSTVGQPILINGTGSRPQLQDVVIGGIESVSIVHDDININHLTLSEAPLILQPSLGTTNANIHGVTLYGSRGNALTIGLQRGESISISNLVIEGADEAHIVMAGAPGQISCTNCEVDFNKLVPLFGGMIALRQTVSAVVTDANGDPIMNAVVAVTDGRGFVIDSMTTDADGIAEIDVEVAIVTDVMVDHRPITVVLRARDGSTQDDTVRVQGWTQAFFSDTTRPSSVFETNRDHTWSVTPNPVNHGSEAQLSDFYPLNTVTVVDLQGRVLLEIDVTDANTVSLPLSKLSSGFYLVQYYQRNKLSSVPLIVR